MEFKRELEEIALPRERRLNMRLMAFWWDRRAERRFPSAEDFNQEALSDVWTHCFTLYPSEPRESSALSYIGETLAASSGMSEAATTLGQVRKNSLLDHALKSIDEVLAQKVPLIRSGEFTNEAGETLRFRSILLPLSQDQKTIDCVVGGARSKVMRPN